MRYDNFDLFDIIHEEIINIYFDMKEYECDKDLDKNLDRLFRIAEVLDIKITNDYKIITWDYDTVDKLIKEIEDKYPITFERKEDENFYYFICNINGFIHNFYLSKANKVLYARYTLVNVTCNGLVSNKGDVLFEIRRWLTKLGVIKEISILKMEHIE